MLLRARLRDVHKKAAIAAVLLTIASALASGPAAAGTEPTITAAPKQVGFERDATIEGRAEPATTVRLERIGRSGEWDRIATEESTARGRVLFAVQDLRRSSAYRLAVVDEVTGQVMRSDRVHIAVKARLTLKISKRHVMNGRRVRVYGSLFPKVPGRRVYIAQKVDGRWRRVARERAGDGWFSTYLRPRAEGRRRLRVEFAGDSHNRRVTDRGRVHVYAPGLATWYGPGLYGNTTACGQTLRPNTLGIAHRTLACGTDVSILFRGRTITVPVIDRGPYSHADWDLTAETAERLGFSGRDTIGTNRN